MVQSLFSFHNRATLSELLKLAWPVVLARLGIMTMGLTDAIVVGHYASRELAYHSLAWAPSSVVLTTAVGLMMGVQVMTARLLGEGRGDEVGAVLRRGMTYALQIGFVAMIGLLLLGPDQQKIHDRHDEKERGDRAKCGRVHFGEPAEKPADYSGAAFLCNHGKSRT